MRVVTCVGCGATWESTVATHDAALAEMRELFGELPEAEQAIVCDACFETAMATFPPPRKN